MGGKTYSNDTAERKGFRARSFLIGPFFRLDFFIGGKSLVDIYLSSGIVTSLFGNK